MTAGLDPLTRVGWTGIEYNARFNGLKGDGVTDDTVALQALIDKIAASGKDGTILFPPGTYIIGGALQDTGASNAQIVLPKRTTMLTLRFRGPTPAPTFAKTRSTTGAILKSTLTTGTGHMIGVQGTVTFAGITTLTDLNFHIENLTLEMDSNPTNSCLDLSNIPNHLVRNVQINTGEQIVTDAGPPIVYGITEPTTATSYGLKLPINNLPSPYVRVQNVEIIGFYTGILSRELATLDNVTIVFSKVGIEQQAAIQRFYFRRIWMANVATGIKFTGGISNGYIDCAFEHQTNPAWTTTVYDIDDLNDYAHGQLDWDLLDVATGTVSDALTVRGAKLLSKRRTYSSWNYREPYTEIFSGFKALDPSVIEVDRGSPTSGDTKFGAVVLSNEQSGTGNLIGLLAYVNKVLSGEKRLFQIGVVTDGATNHGKGIFTVANGGVLGEKMAITRNGVQIGAGTALSKVLKGTVTVNPANVVTLTVSSQTFTLTGAVVGDSLTLNPPSAGLTAGLLVLQYYVSAADQITIVFHNTTGADIDEASASWTYTLVRS